MRTDVRPPALTYAVAVLAVGASLLARELLTPLLGHRVPYLLFYPAVVVAAWFGGLRPGLLATGLGAAAAVLVVRPPGDDWVPDTVADAVPVAVYLLMGVLVSAVCEQLHRAVRRAGWSAGEAEVERARAADILESVTDAFYALDHDWRYTFVNRRCEQYYGKGRDELLGRVVWEVFPAAVGTAFDEQFRRAVREQRAVDFEVLSPHSNRWVEVRAYPSAAGLSVYFRDVHERKAAEAALEASERRLNDVLDNAPVVVFMKDLAGRFVMVNRQYEMLFGVRRADVIGRTVHDIHRPEVADVLAANDRAVLATGVARELEERVSVPGGGVLTYLSAKFPLRDAAGVAYATCGIANDITLRKRAETALAASEARKAAVLRAALDCLVTIDHAGRVVEFNPAAERTFGPPASDRRTSPAAARGGSADLPPVAPVAARLLLVEDHADTLRVISRLLRHTGFVVTTAESVEEAADHLESSDFDLLVSDIGLPDGSGTDVMAIAKVKGVPGVALSGFGTGEDVARRLAAGFAEHLTKPIDFARLEAATRRLVSPGRGGDAANGHAGGKTNEHNLGLVDTGKATEKAAFR